MRSIVTRREDRSAEGRPKRPRTCRWCDVLIIVAVVVVLCCVLVPAVVKPASPAEDTPCANFLRRLHMDETPQEAIAEPVIREPEPLPSEHTAASGWRVEAGR